MVMDIAIEMEVVGRIFPEGMEAQERADQTVFPGHLTSDGPIFDFVPAIERNRDGTMKDTTTLALRPELVIDNRPDTEGGHPGLLAGPLLIAMRTDPEKARTLRYEGTLAMVTPHMHSLPTEASRLTMAGKDGIQDIGMRPVPIPGW